MTLTNFRPSKRPSVKSVKRWDLVFDDYTDRHWRGDAYNGGVEVLRGYPFPDFYKVVFIPEKSSEFAKKISKLFYGESAHHNVVRFVADLGFQSVYNSDLI